MPSDFGAALQGFTKMLGAPGDDGVFRYQPSPVEEDLPKPEDDSAEVAEWFTTQTDPVKIERDLMARVPEAEWIDLSHRLILHGRRVCVARSPRCQACLLSPSCPRRGVPGG